MSEAEPTPAPLPPTPTEPRWALGVLPAAGLMLFSIAVLRTAWLSDDGFVTFHAIDNLRSGFGYVSNPGERVMGFTNPLWGLLVLAPYSAGASIYAAAMGTALVCSALTAVLLVCRLSTNRATAALVGVALAASSAFVDFSTSGLENPLAHLLLVAFFAWFLSPESRPTSIVPWLLGAAVALDRLDHLVLVAPALATLLLAEHSAVPAATWRRRVRPRLVSPFRPAVRAALIGLSPLVLWLGFACIYYGFPYPNTAYAKLNSRIPSQEIFAQGFVYYLDALRRDPATLFVIALGVTAAFRVRSRRSLATGAGVLLYLVYIVRVGGDFMAGRFFTAPFIVSVTLLARAGLSRASHRELAGVAAILAFLAFHFSTSFTASERLECIVGPTGIVNERHCYAEHTGLADNVRREKYRTHDYFKKGTGYREHGEHFVDDGLPGMMGYAAGPGVHIIDPYALTDPLLARIPYGPDPGWRIGHFRRAMPAGYAESVRTRHNVIEDPCVHAYYEVLDRVIRGPLFTVARFRAIWGLNTGGYDSWVRRPCPR